MNDNSADGASSGDRWKSAFGALAFAGVWCAFSFYFYYLIAVDSHDTLNPGARIVSSLFVLIGLAMLSRALRITADAIKFGAISLTPQLPPAFPGGTLRATLTLRDRTHDINSIDVQLCCISVSYTRPVRSVSISEATRWTSRKSFSVQPTGKNCRADIAIAIPRDLPATDLPGERPEERNSQEVFLDRPYYRWELVVTAEAPGLNLERRFPVVVAAAPFAAADAEPGPAPAPAAGKNARQASGPTSRQIRMNRALALACFGALLLGQMLLGYIKSRNLGLEQFTSAFAKSMRDAGLLSKVAWTRDTTAWDLPLSHSAKHMGIAIRGVHPRMSNNALQIDFDELLLEKHPDLPQINFGPTIMIDGAIHAMDGAEEGRQTGSFSAGLVGAKGMLTRETPAVSLRNVEFRAQYGPGSIVKRVKLTLRTEAKLADGTMIVVRTVPFTVDVP